MRRMIIAAAATLAVPMALSAQQWGNLPAAPDATADLTAAPYSLTGDLRSAVVLPSGNVAISVEDDDLVLIVDSALAEVGRITGADTGDGTVDPYQIAATADGQIFVNGYAGTVERLGTAPVGTAASAGVSVVTGLGAGNSRAVTAVGDWSAGTAILLVGRGTDVNILTQAGPGSDVFSVVSTITHGFTSEVEGIAINAAQDTIYLLNNGSPLKKFTGTVGGAWTLDAGFAPGATLFRTGLRYVESKGVFLTSVDSLSSNGHVLTMSGPDGNSLATKIYTPQVGNNGSGSPAIDVANNLIYTVGGNQIMKFTPLPPSSVTVGPSGDFATIQAAITSFCAGGVNATAVPPFTINIDPAGTYNERISLDDAAVGLGDIVGDITLQSSVPGTYATLALQRDAGEAAGTGSSCLKIYQNEHDVTLRDLIIHPALPVASVTEDARRHIVKLDENSANATLNTITLDNCIVTEVAASGAPMISSRAEAYVAPAGPGASARDNNFSNTIQFWGDAGESYHVVLNKVVCYGRPPGGTQVGNHLRGIMAGSNGESITVTDSVFAYGPSAGQLARIGSTTFTGPVSITGTDQTAGPDNANVFINAGSNHALTFEGSLATGNAGNCTAEVSEAIFVYDTVAGTAATQRAISVGSAIWEPTLSNLLIKTPGAAIVAFADNAAVWSNITAVSDQALFSLGGAGSIAVTDSIFSGADTVAADGKFGGTAPAGGVTVDFSAFDTNVVNQIGTTVTGTFTAGANILVANPVFTETADVTSADLFDVQASVYAGAGSASSDLAGGADYTPGPADVTDWMILND